jgi:PAS domain S-box-containing protein
MLMTSDNEMFHFFEMTPDFVCIAGKDGFFKNINHAVIDKLGYTKEELLQMPISDLIHPDDKELTARKRKELLKGKALINFENRYVTKNGFSVWLHWTSIYLADKEIVFAIAKDISKRKEADREIENKYKQFRNLASHFKASLEKDKKNLAAELHEQLAQLAWIIKSDLNWIDENVNGIDEQLTDRVQHATSVTEMLINSIRNLSYSIGPGMLDEMGLNETLRWLCNDFSRDNLISCTFDCRFDDQHLPREIQLDLYRICQEALKNISEHAEAKTVNIILEQEQDKVCLTITDDGKGFDTEKATYSPGLINMRERAASINGKIVFVSEVGKGTTIRVLVAQQVLSDN